MTDFTKWSRASLEQFAKEAAQENRELREQNKGLLRAYRAEVIRNARAASSQSTETQRTEYEECL